MKILPDNIKIENPYPRSWPITCKCCGNVIEIAPEMQMAFSEGQQSILSQCKEIDLNDLFDYLKEHQCIYSNLTFMEFRIAFSQFIQEQISPKVIENPNHILINKGKPFTLNHNFTIIKEEQKEGKDGN
jgi:hypothetical protein